jgi:hypothetical protein
MGLRTSIRRIWTRRKILKSFRKKKTKLLFEAIICVNSLHASQTFFPLYLLTLKIVLELQLRRYRFNVRVSREEASLLKVIRCFRRLSSGINRH